jgi:chromosome segregation ATPase
MVTLEQVKLLETRVVKALEFVNRVTGENTLLKEKLDTYQQRIDELEVLVQCFKEDQSRIEEGIISALNRLNQFEDAVEKSLSMVQNRAVPPGKTESPHNDVSKKPDKPAEPSTGTEKSVEDDLPDFPAKLDEAFLMEPPADEAPLTAAESDPDFPLGSPDERSLYEMETEDAESSAVEETAGSVSEANIAELDIF